MDIIASNLISLLTLKNANKLIMSFTISQKSGYLDNGIHFF